MQESEAHGDRDSGISATAVADEAAIRPLPAGSLCTETGGAAHFALTKADPVVVYVTGFGPTDTV
jgi:hypothetical protein